DVLIQLTCRWPQNVPRHFNVEINCIFYKRNTKVDSADNMELEVTGHGQLFDSIRNIYVDNERKISKVTNRI
ncbi:hypothetical protein AVEN_194247-1, partial [Araneus ventricosus]